MKSLRSEEGFVADRITRPASHVRTRRRIPPYVLAAFAGIVLTSAIVVSTNDDGEETREGEIGVLWAVERISNATCTRWLFPTESWLYDAGNDFSFTMEVYNCSGPTGTVEVWANSYVDSFDYKGQETVYLGFTHTVTYYPNGTVHTDEWQWLGNLTRDWRERTWNPSDGIEFQHCENQTFGEAKLVALYFTPIPEFSSVFAVVAMTIVTSTLLRRYHHHD